MRTLRHAVMVPAGIVKSARHADKSALHTAKMQIKAAKTQPKKRKTAEKAEYMAPAASVISGYHAMTKAAFHVFS